MLADVVACNGVQCIHISVYIFLYTVKQFIFATPLSRGGGGAGKTGGKWKSASKKATAITTYAQRVDTVNNTETPGHRISFHPHTQHTRKKRNEIKYTDEKQ